MRSILDDGFQVGINFPWLKRAFASDFGHNMFPTNLFSKRPYVSPTFPSSSSDTPFFETNEGAEAVEEMFQKINGSQIQIIRVWAFEKFEGIVFDNNFNIVGLEPTFLKNIELLFDIAEKNNVKIYLCLLDAWELTKSVRRFLEEELNIRTKTPLIMLDEGNIRKAKDYLNLLSEWKKIFKNIIDSDTDGDFLNKVVLPLLQKISSKNSLFAIDVFNEPESLFENNIFDAFDNSVFEILSGSQKPFNYLTFTEEESIKLIYNVSKYIKKKFPSLLTSCGFMNFETLSRNRSSFDHLNFYDIHNYTSVEGEFNLPTYDSNKFSGKKCILGECGRKPLSNEVKNDPHYNKDDEESKNLSDLSKFFSIAKAKGYSGLLIWKPEDYTNSDALIDLAKHVALSIRPN